MTLHLLAIEKFVEYAISLFDSADPGNNSYILLTKEKKNTSIDYRWSSKVKIIELYSQEYLELKKRANQFQSIILHSLHPVFFDLVINVSFERPIIWIMFGADYYSTYKSYRKSLLLPLTKRIDQHYKKYLKAKAKSVYRTLIGKKSNNTYVKQCLKNIEYCAAAQKETYFSLMKSGDSHAKFLDFHYYSIEDTVGVDLMNKSIEGNNILIGNSASVFNNHLDTFSLIKDLPLKNRRIVVPLSYGEKNIQKKVANKGYQIFKNQFFPIKEFIPRKKYNQILLSCSVVIMNHLRPQARGNIITALWLGAKVYLNPQSIFYSDFKNKGLSIFPITDIKNKPFHQFARIEGHQIQLNQNILLQEYSKEAVLKHCKTMLDRISKT